MPDFANTPRSTAPFVRISLLCLLIVLPLAALRLLPASPLTQQLVNISAALIVLVEGIAVIRVMWDLEKQNLGMFPLASCYFTVQHIAFGCGGLMLSVANDGYFYQNDQGEYGYGEMMLALLVAHFVSMNAGLVGVWVASGRHSGRFQMSAGAMRQSRTNAWSWGELSAICQVSLFLHALMDVIISLPENSIPTVVTYIAEGMAPSLNATFLFWGISWQSCTKKYVLALYGAMFLLTEIIHGQRQSFLFAGALFGLGVLVSRGGLQIGWGRLIKISPLFLLLFWAFNRAENMRAEFSRSVPGSSAEAVARLDALAGGGASGVDPFLFLDAQGIRVNGPFRVASRIFETSALDVVARTPSDVPYAGWTKFDWDDLLYETLPLKMNAVAAATVQADERVGVLFLHDYGWSAVDPSRGNAMPATLIADSWRRFGWMGVIVWFALLGWMLARGSAVFRNANRKIVFIFAGALIPNTAFLYVSDIVSVIATTPRRLILAFGYALIVGGIGWTIQGRRRATAGYFPALSESGRGLARAAVARRI